MCCVSAAFASPATACDVDTRDLQESGAHGPGRIEIPQQTPDTSLMIYRCEALP